jgi:glutaredoxin
MDTELQDKPVELDSETDRLVLYHFRGCIFCYFVNSAIKRLGLDVELRNIHQDSDYRNQLQQARGRTTVPVLRIISPNGGERWMPESRDIIHYLDSVFG